MSDMSKLCRFHQCTELEKDYGCPACLTQRIDVAEHEINDLKSLLVVALLPMEQWAVASDSPASVCKARRLEKVRNYIGAGGK